MPAGRPHAFFLDDGRGPDDRLLCIYHPPQGTPRAAMLFAPPFGEELNKSRRMVACQARAFAAAGVGVLTIDLTGCGDSGGDLAHASWEGWLDDLDLGLRWLKDRLPGAPTWLWGLRSGALLASDLSARLHQVPDLLLWQPSVQGRAVLQQFLRLKAAAQMLDGQGKGVTDALRQDLQAGRAVDVAGYTLPPAVALPLDRASLAAPRPGQRVRWLEVSPREEPELMPATRLLLQRWNAGDAAQALAVGGPAFWQTTEIEDAPALLPASLQQVLA